MDDSLMGHFDRACRHPQCGMMTHREENIKYSCWSIIGYNGTLPDRHYSRQKGWIHKQLHKSIPFSKDMMKNENNGQSIFTFLKKSYKKRWFYYGFGLISWNWSEDWVEIDWRSEKLTMFTGNFSSTNKQL